MFSGILKSIPGLPLLLAMPAAVATLAVGSVLAHDNRDTGGYKFVVGFRVEPGL